MSNVRISDLVQKTSILDTDVLVISDGASTNKITWGDLKNKTVGLSLVEESDSSFRPKITNNVDLGETGYEWRNGSFVGTVSTGNILLNTGGFIDSESKYDPGTGEIPLAYLSLDDGMFNHAPTGSLSLTSGEWSHVSGSKLSLTAGIFGKDDRTQFLELPSGIFQTGNDSSNYGQLHLSSNYLRRTVSGNIGSELTFGDNNNIFRTFPDASSGNTLYRIQLDLALGQYYTVDVSGDLINMLQLGSAQTDDNMYMQSLNNIFFNLNDAITSDNGTKEVGYIAVDLNNDVDTYSNHLLNNAYRQSPGNVIPTIAYVDASGDAASRPTNPRLGKTYFNTDTSKPEWYDGTQWISIEGGGSLPQPLDVTDSPTFAGITINSSGIALGTNAGSSTNSVNIGFTAGRSGQESYAIALGYEAGNDSQSSYAIALGFQAGLLRQSDYSIAIGREAGESDQGDYSIAMGREAGESRQGDNSIALGFKAGGFNQGSSSVAFGYNAGSNAQGNVAVAIGNNTGQNNQGVHSISIGNLAGQDDQARNGIIISSLGSALNDTTEGHVHLSSSTGSLDYNGTDRWDFSGGIVNLPTNSTIGGVPIVGNGGNPFDQSLNTTDDVIFNKITLNSSQISLGVGAGLTSQSELSIALGSGAGQSNQGSSEDNGSDDSGLTTGAAVAIGRDAGNTYQPAKSVYIGLDAGKIHSEPGGSGDDSVGTSAIAIGTTAGYTGQSNVAIAIGKNSGHTDQGPRAIAIGNKAGNSNQDWYGIALGDESGETSQGDFTIAIGKRAGRNNQGNKAIAIGSYAGETNQGEYAIAIGSGAGSGIATSQGAYSIAIGRNAGQFNMHANSIVISSEGNSSVRTISEGDIIFESSVAKLEYSVANTKWSYAGGIVDLPSGSTIDGNPIASGGGYTAGDGISSTELALGNIALDLSNYTAATSIDMKVSNTFDVGLIMEGASTTGARLYYGSDLTEGFNIGASVTGAGFQTMSSSQSITFATSWVSSINDAVVMLVDSRTTNTNPKGIQYGANYSEDWGSDSSFDNFLPTKKYVDSLLASGSYTAGDGIDATALASDEIALDVSGYSADLISIHAGNGFGDGSGIFAMPTTMFISYSDPTATGSIAVKSIQESFGVAGHSVAITNADTTVTAQSYINVQRAGFIFSPDGLDDRNFKIQEVGMEFSISDTIIFTAGVDNSEDTLSGPTDWSTNQITTTPSADSIASVGYIDFKTSTLLIDILKSLGNNSDNGVTGEGRVERGTGNDYIVNIGDIASPVVGIYYKISATSKTSVDFSYTIDSTDTSNILLSFDSSLPIEYDIEIIIK